MQNTISLVNELSLGSRLNQAVEANRRGEFGLLLALISDEQQNMPQFQIKPSSTDQDDRAQFNLPPEQLLVADLNIAESIVNNSHAFHVSGTTGFRLQDGLMQEALVIRKGQGAALESVIKNCDYHTQLRTQGEYKTIETEAVTLIEQLTTQRQMSQVLLQA
ncbi:VC2046/SO_2500 family protein [uncultured Shewanella sp.]|uniref:VC2046/SO_2500 family protein n=1 Tax=uncultured Shewanella sp. TaxID=173975 RepID=UPI00262CA5C6|nr:VC2046/SO_2500 family protein [uncultured Shewanella sp.]